MKRAKPEPQRVLIEEQELVYPQKRYVILTKAEIANIQVCMERLWSLMDTLGEVTETTSEMVVDHQRAQVACGKIQIEVIHLNSAVIRAMKAGWYVANPEDATAPGAAS